MPRRGHNRQRHRRRKDRRHHAPRIRNQGPLSQSLGDFFPHGPIPLASPPNPNVPPHAKTGEPTRSRIPEGWWERAFADEPTSSERRGHRCGERQMLTIVAYDITKPRRLREVAKLCEDYGVRVQYSIFECRLEAALFDEFWSELLATIDPDTDRVTAYKVCQACAKEVRDAGTMVHSEKVVAYVF